jgi:electron transport complex protein RnfB
MSTIDPIYKKLAVKMNAPKNKVLPKLLNKIADLEQARIANELPNTADNIAEKLGLNKTKVEKQLKYLNERGLVMRGKTGWVMVNQTYFFVDNLATAKDKYVNNELLDLAREMNLEDVKSLPRSIKRGEKIPPVFKISRVVPKWRTIKDIPGILPYEDAREILKSASLIAVHKCPCRVVYGNRPFKGEEGIEVCLALNALAQHYLENGTGKKLTYDEAIAFLDKIDKFSLVNLTMNANTMPDGFCSCSDSCSVFVRTSYTKPLLGEVQYAKSRFEVQDDPKKCAGCGICIKRCPVNAITMKELKSGKKLVSTNLEECMGCGICVLSCPKKARKMKLVRPPEHIPNLQMPPDARAA